MAVPPPVLDKPGLRAHLRDARAEHVAALAASSRLLEETERAAAQVVARLPEGAAVALYHPLADELSPAPLTAILRTRGHRLALPHVEADRVTMTFRAWVPGEELERAPFGLWQPTGQVLIPAVVLTPLIGFDRQGGRIGQGAGHYDRAFAALPGALRIGYAWSVQEVERVPHDPWDVALHAIATEREWISVGSAR
jgi:5-formyltetrahydrofolate cyclo-ligase